MKLNNRFRFYLLFVVAAAVYGLSPFRLGVVIGDSMSPSMRSGEVYFFNRLNSDPHRLRRGDVVVFQKDGRHYIKRVAALPGDLIYLLRRRESDGADTLVMDWQLPKLQRALSRATWTSIKLVGRRVPQDCVYVLGDHLEISEDSRTYGPVYRDQIRGRLLSSPPPTRLLRHVAGRFEASDRS